MEFDEVITGSWKFLQGSYDIWSREGALNSAKAREKLSVQAIRSKRLQLFQSPPPLKIC